MPFFAQPVLTWYEPPVLAEVYRRVRVYDHSRRALLVLLVVLLAVLGPLPLFRTWVLPPHDSYMPWYEGCGFALILWTPFAMLYGVVAWLERRGVRLRIPMRWYAQGRRCWLSMGITRVPCTVLQEYVPVRIALDGYDVHLIRCTGRRGALFAVAFPDAATAARVNELLAAAGVPRGTPLELTSWNDICAFYMRMRSSGTHFTLFTKRPWRIILVAAALPLVLIAIARTVVVLAFFSPWPASATPVIIPAFVTGTYTHCAHDTVHTTAWAVFAVHGTITHAETRSNGAERITAPPCVISMGKPYTPGRHTNYVAYAPHTATERLVTDAVFSSHFTNLLITFADEQQAAWLARPVPVWQMAYARPQAFWAHFLLRISRNTMREADAVTLVNTPHVNGIMYYLWEGSTARVARVVLQDHGRTQMMSASLRVPPGARSQLPRVATTLAASFRFASPGTPAECQR